MMDAKDNTQDVKTQDVKIQGVKTQGDEGSSNFYHNSAVWRRVRLRYKNKKFNHMRLPADMRSIFKTLCDKNGREKALCVVFAIKTAVELHRAWHMTLLTSKLLEQLNEHFDLQLTWELGVLKLHFSIAGGDFEILRKVPYDYDSEFQNQMMKVANALLVNHIDIETAMNFHTELLKEKHTSPMSKLMRNYPWRLVIHAVEAFTCAVVFFGGDWVDGGIAALCGLVGGILAYSLDGTSYGSVVVDLSVGVSTGVIAGLFYSYGQQDTCVSGILLGTLYWFFYGTAFVIGLLEIIAGELWTGVTRFTAVSIKTFVLCLGASYGLQGTSSDVQELWVNQADNCNQTFDISDEWFRLPMYVFCSAACLAQFRYPVHGWPIALAIQVVAYESQYQLQAWFAGIHVSGGNIDIASSNFIAAGVAVMASFLVFGILNQLRRVYYNRILIRAGDPSGCDSCMYEISVCCVSIAKLCCCLSESASMKVEIEKKFRESAEETQGLLENGDGGEEILLTEEEEGAFLQTLIFSEHNNVWAVLMPALYMLVPGSMIAKMWFDTIFPVSSDISSDMFSDLMVISGSLALGLIVGFVFSHLFIVLGNNIARTACCKRAGCGRHEHKEKLQHARVIGMFSSAHKDPSWHREESISHFEPATE